MKGVLKIHRETYERERYERNNFESKASPRSFLQRRHRETPSLFRCRSREYALVFPDLICVAEILPSFRHFTLQMNSQALSLCLNLRRSRNCKSARKISNEKYALSAEVRLNSSIFHVCRSKIRRSETPRIRRKISDWKILLELNLEAFQNLETSIFEIIVNDWCL